MKVAAVFGLPLLIAALETQLVAPQSSSGSADLPEASDASNSRGSSVWEDILGDITGSDMTNNFNDAKSARETLTRLDKSAKNFDDLDEDDQEKYMQAKLQSALASTQLSRSLVSTEVDSNSSVSDAVVETLMKQAEGVKIEGDWNPKGWWGDLLNTSSGTSYGSTDENGLPNLKPEDLLNDDIGDRLVLQLAVLKKLDAEDIESSGARNELFGDLADQYIQASEALVVEGNVNDAVKIITSDVVETLSALAKEVCDGIQLRFCLFPQLSMLSSTYRVAPAQIYDPKRITNLDTEEARMDRQEYLTNLRDKLGKQRVGQRAAEMVNGVVENMYKSNAWSKKQIDQAWAQKSASELDQLSKMMTSQTERLTKVSEINFDKAETAVKVTQGYIDDFVNGKVEKAMDTFTEHLEVICEEALKAAKRAQASGFLNFLISALKVITIIPLVLDPTTIVDVVRDGHELDKDTDGVDGVKTLTKYLKNELIPAVGDIGKKAKETQKQSLKVAKTIQTIMDRKDPSEDQIAEDGQQFLNAYRDFDLSAIRGADVDSLGNKFSALTDEFCGMAGNYALEPCAARAEDNKVFMYWGMMPGLSLDILENYVTMAEQAVRKKASEALTKNLKEAASKTKKSITSINETYADEQERAEQRFNVYSKQLKYTQSILGLDLLSTAIQGAEAAVNVCDFYTYLNGGSPIDPCISIYENPTNPDIDLDKIESFNPNKKPDEHDFTAYIPTHETETSDNSSDSTTRFIRVGALMGNGGRNISIRLPQDPDWLYKYGWVDPGYNPDEDVVFLKRLAVLLPPKYAPPKDGEESQVVTTKVVVTAPGDSDLGPALGGKTYRIPERHFDFEYKERKAGEDCETITNMYGKCWDDDVELCKVSDGSVDVASDEVPLPSLFSKLDVIVTFDQYSNDGEWTRNNMSYHGVQDAAPIVVYGTTATYKVSSESKSAMAAVEKAASGDGKGASDTSSGGETKYDIEDLINLSLSNTDVTISSKTGGGDSDGATKDDSKSESGGVAGMEHDDEDEDDNTGGISMRQRLLRRLDSSDKGSKGRCCTVGSFLTDWDSEECASCPTNYASQMGGLYCVPWPNTTSSGESD